MWLTQWVSFDSGTCTEDAASDIKLDLEDLDTDEPASYAYAGLSHRSCVIHETSLCIRHFALNLPADLRGPPVPVAPGDGELSPGLYDVYVLTDGRATLTLDVQGLEDSGTLELTADAHADAIVEALPNVGWMLLFAPAALLLVSNACLGGRRCQPRAAHHRTAAYHHIHQFASPPGNAPDIAIGAVSCLAGHNYNSYQLEIAVGFEWFDDVAAACMPVEGSTVTIGKSSRAGVAEEVIYRVYRSPFDDPSLFRLRRAVFDLVAPCDAPPVYQAATAAKGSPTLTTIECDLAAP